MSVSSTTILLQWLLIVSIFQQGWSFTMSPSSAGAARSTSRVTSANPSLLVVRHRRIDSAVCMAKGFGKSDDDNKPSGDKLRASTGIRPSLHPIVINAIADALKQRSLKELGKGDAELHFAVTDSIAPMDVALTAGTFSAKYLGQRQENDDEPLTEKEEQTVAGRIMGVIMRLQELEEALDEAVSNTQWIADYGEHASFGVVEDNATLQQNIVDNPLLALNRAECLLGIFLKEVEMPQLQRVGETVPDQSKIDFLDADRIEVLGLTNE